MNGYQVFRISPGVYDFLDKGMSSFYLVEGQDKAIAIDTGITEGAEILPLLRKYTDRPIELALTHAHIDHWYHIDEFETVYMSHREFETPEPILRGMMGGKELHPERALDIRTGSVIDLGGRKLEVCEVPGHTPGSVVFLDSLSNRLFTGDAIGSGMGVWMQVPSALPLDQYYTSLTRFLSWLVERGGRMTFHGGHRFQMFQSPVMPGFNPPGMGLLCDLIDLVDQIVQGKIVGRLSSVDKVMELEPPLYASYGRAEIQYMPSRIHTGK